MRCPFFGPLRGSEDSLAGSLDGELDDRPTPRRRLTLTEWLTDRAYDRNMPTDDDRPCFDPSDLTRLVRTKITVCGCGCWVWTGSCDSHGYGKVKMRNKTIIIHRYVYEHFFDPLPTTDDTIDHLCDRHRTCVNPNHFEVVSRSLNSSRANDRRWHAEKPDRSNCTV